MDIFGFKRRKQERIEKKRLEDVLAEKEKLEQIKLEKEAYQKRKRLILEYLRKYRDEQLSDAREMMRHETEEAYTSKCDALALEEIGKHEEYIGKRKKRGLFQSGTGKLINADVNGTLNIMRKVAGDSGCVARIIGRGLLFRPRRLGDLYSLSGAEAIPERKP